MKLLKKVYLFVFLLTFSLSYAQDLGDDQCEFGCPEEPCLRVECDGPGTMTVPLDDYQMVLLGLALSIGAGFVLYKKQNNKFA